MQVEKQGKQDPRTFGIATLPGTLMSQKCNQFICFPCYLFSLAPGVVWSWGLILWVLTSALQLGGKRFGQAHICIFWCGLGVSPFMQIIAIFTTVSFCVCLKREWGKCRIPWSEAHCCLCGSGATSISGRMILFRGRRVDRRGILQHVGNSSVAKQFIYTLSWEKSKFFSLKYLLI